MAAGAPLPTGVATLQALVRELQTENADLRTPLRGQAERFQRTTDELQTEVAALTNRSKCGTRLKVFDGGGETRRDPAQQLTECGFVLRHLLLVGWCPPVFGTRDRITRAQWRDGNAAIVADKLKDVLQRVLRLIGVHHDRPTQITPRRVQRFEVGN